VRQVEHEEVRLLLDAADDNHGLAEVRLPMPGRMRQRHEHLLAAPIPITHVVLDNRVPASKPVFVTEPVEHPLGRMTLLARNRPIRLKPSVNDWDESFQLWTPNRSPPSIAGRNRIRHHFANRVARYAEMLRRFALAHTAVASNSNLQI
jgi:hypothetical protein